MLCPRGPTAALSIFRPDGETETRRDQTPASVIAGIALRGRFRALIDCRRQLGGRPKA